MDNLHLKQYVFHLNLIKQIRNSINSGRYVIKRIQSQSKDPNVLTIKTSGKPTTFVRTIMPQKAIANADEAVRRKAHQAHKTVTDIQVE